MCKGIIHIAHFLSSSPSYFTSMTFFLSLSLSLFFSLSLSARVLPHYYSPIRIGHSDTSDRLSGTFNEKHEAGWNAQEQNQGRNDGSLLARQLKAIN